MNHDTKSDFDEIACQDSFWMLHTINGATEFYVRGTITGYRQCCNGEERFPVYFDLKYSFYDVADMHWKYVFPDMLVLLAKQGIDIGFGLIDPLNLYKPDLLEDYEIRMFWDSKSRYYESCNENEKGRMSGWPFE